MQIPTESEVIYQAIRVYIYIYIYIIFREVFVGNFIFKGVSADFFL